MNRDSIKVSVLMLTYNQEAYIDEAIRSVMLQKRNFSLELIIGNDASTDNTASICQKWKEHYPQEIILLNHATNLGLQQNFIQSYALCRGEYIAICEGDDYWCHPKKLQQQVDFLDKHPEYSTCFHRVVNFYENNGTKSLSNGKQKQTTGILDLARSNYISNVSSIFRRGLFGELPEWFSKVSTYDYAIHLLNAQYGKIYYMKIPMAVYRQHQKAIWSEAGMDKKLDIALTIRELLIDHFAASREDVCKLLRNAHSQICINLIRYYQKTGQQQLMEESQLRLLKYQPEKNMNYIRVELAKKMPSPSVVKKVLKWGRGMVSLLLPLPRIK